jgi:hypothetical protein
VQSREQRAGEQRAESRRAEEESRAESKAESSRAKQTHQKGQKSENLIKEGKRREKRILTRTDPKPHPNLHQH